MPQFINLDFADVTAVMKDAGHAHMGIGHASGKDKAEAAANDAISSPLLETTIEGAKYILINFSGDENLGLFETDEAAELIREAIDPEAEIIFGTSINEDLVDEVVVTVIATGFGTDSNGIANKSGAAVVSDSYSSADDDDGDIVDILGLFKK